MHLLLPALIRIFKANASVEVRCAAIRSLIRLIPRVQVEVRSILFLAQVRFGLWLNYNSSFFLPSLNQVTGHISALVHHLKLVLDGSDFPLIFLKLLKLKLIKHLTLKMAGDLIF